MPNTLLVVGGPSCAGKSPLVTALRRMPEFSGYAAPVLHHSRAPRPGEVDGRDYHFRTRGEIEALRGDARYRVFAVRDQVQAFDLDEVRALLAAGDVVYEGNVDMALAMAAVGAEAGVRVVDVFLAPLALAEVAALSRRADFAERVVEMMRRRLIRRALGKSLALSLPQLADIEARAGTVAAELAQAFLFTSVVPCADGEDSDHWTLFSEPVGDAGRALRAVATLLRGGTDATAERWPRDLLA
jgi:guanylate kinase